MKVALATTITKKFLPYLRALLNSINTNSASITHLPFYCFTETNDTHEIRLRAKDYTAHIDFDFAINSKERKQLKELYPSIQIRNIQIFNYTHVLKFSPFFWRMDTFNLCGYDKVIFFDADMLCLKDISGLLDIECDIGTTEQTTNQRDWNWGLFMVGKKHLNLKTYRRLLNSKHDKKKPAEPMHLFTKLFKNPYEISQDYNRIVPPLDFNDIHKYFMLHYIYKPLTKQEGLIQPEFLNLWKSYSI